MECFTFHAPAKINLCLHIMSRLSSGYHELETIIVFSEYGDQLHIHHSDAYSLTIDGPFAHQLAYENNNLCTKAVQLFEDYTSITANISIKLIKNIPVAAGLGGGSSDAASLLLALNTIYKTDLSIDQLRGMALQLGADVPLCLEQQTSFVTGIGDQIEAHIAHDDLYILLLNPLKPIATPAIFSLYTDQNRAPHDSIKPYLSKLSSINSLVDYMENDLEQAAIQYEPSIQARLTALRSQHHILHAGLSGSGATCFALFDQKDFAEKSLSLIKQTFPYDWAITSPILFK